MTTRKGSDNRFPLVRILRDADTPDTPPAGEIHLRVDDDGLIYTVDEDDNVVMLGGAGGAVAAEDVSIADAGTYFMGTDVEAALQELGAAVREFAYVERTSTLTVTATSEATGQSVVSAGAVTFDGSTRVCIEFFCPELSIATTDAGIVLDLSDGGTEIGRMGTYFASDAGDARVPVLLRRFLTPSAASHTYAIQAWRVTANGGIDAGAGGSGTLMPAYIRITEA